MSSKPPREYQVVATATKQPPIPYLWGVGDVDFSIYSLLTLFENSVYLALAEFDTFGYLSLGVALEVEADFS